MENEKFLDFALKVTEKTSDIIRTYEESTFTISTKEDKSVLTEVDLKVEQFIRSEISKQFPDHGIIGEEYENTNSDSSYQWIIDPIDGTRSFSHRIPLYGTLLALHHLGKPIVGVIDHPGIGIKSHASLNNGTYSNDKRIVLEDSKDVKSEIIATGDIEQFRSKGLLKDYESLNDAFQFVRTVPDCFGHTLAVKGSVGAMVDYGINLWDFAATQLLIEEAGGKFVSVLINEQKNKYAVVCGKPAVVDYLIGILTPFQS